MENITDAELSAIAGGDDYYIPRIGPESDGPGDIPRNYPS